MPPTTLSSDIDFDEGALLVSFARSAVNGRNVYLAAWNDSGALLGYTTVSGAVLETAVAQLTWHTCEAPEAGTAVYWTVQIPESRALLTLWPEEAVVCLNQNGEQQYFTSGDESLTALLPTPEDALTSQDDAYARETLHSARPGRTPPPRCWRIWQRICRSPGTIRLPDCRTPGRASCCARKKAVAVSGWTSPTVFYPLRRRTPKPILPGARGTA